MLTQPHQSTILTLQKVATFMPLLTHQTQPFHSYDAISVSSDRPACREGWWVYNPQTDSKELAGFVKKGGNLRLVLVRNAGHSVPLNQPLWALRKIEMETIYIYTEYFGFSYIWELTTS